MTKKLRLRPQKAVSSGGVVYTRDGHEIKIALCGRKEPPRWSLPKGTPEDGETIEETAVREAQEETGLKVAVEEPIGSINYWFVSAGDHIRYNKTVHFYLMTALGGSLDDHDPEFDEVAWFDPDEALRRLTFANEVKILNKALAQIRERTGQESS
ncbi:MAG: NUDIX hydrolase [SAR202 cluster bacterium]|nr:NUDIX hydrolase [SAR202 cluster bacterium]